MKNDFYVYAYIRSKDSKTAKAYTPYYIGIDNRAFVKHHGIKPPPTECIVFLKKNLFEQEALDLEIKLIAEYGRKDLNTGILNNKTNVGEGLTNPSLTTRKKLSEAKRNESTETKLKRSIAAKNRIRHPLSEETKKKISKANIGRKREEESKKKMSIAAKGKLKTKETKEKIKKKLKNRPKPICVCPICGKSGGTGAMIRWHFDNCKHLKGN